MKKYLIHFYYGTNVKKADGRFWGAGVSDKEIEAESAQEAVNMLFDLPMDDIADCKPCGRFGDICDIWSIEVYEKLETPDGGWKSKKRGKENE